MFQGTKAGRVQALEPGQPHRTVILCLLGTSNWSGNYFTETAGTSLLVTQNGRGGLRSQLEAVFLRDWYSPYSYDLDASPDSVGNACRLL